MVRPFGLGDPRSFFNSDRSLWRNAAKARDNLVAGEGQFLSLQLIAEQWFWLRHKQITWVYPQKGGVRGLVSTRNLLSSRFWQIHRLLLAGDDAEACCGLLDTVSRYGVEHSVQRIFLRLEHSDSLESAARQAGFHPYLAELLYRADGVSNSRPAMDSGFRPKSAGDDYSLFQLYHASAPDSVRRLGALSFAEWSQTRERPSLAHRVREFVYYEESEIKCWLRLHTHSRKGLFEIMLHPSEETGIEAMADFCLSQMRGCTTALSLVPAFQTGLQRALSARGFQAVAEYCTMVQELAPKVAQPSLAPIRA